MMSYSSLLFQELSQLTALQAAERLLGAEVERNG